MASLPQVQQYISTRYYDSSGKSTDVHVTGISDKALSGIVHAMQVHQALLKSVEAGISNNNQQTSDLAAEIAQNNEERRQRDEHARIDQIGQQRVHRAEQAVLTGQIEDVLSGIDALKEVFKSVFDSLKNILKDNFKRVMKAYDDFSATMRKKNMSTEDKNLAHMLADKAFLKTDDLGLNVSKDQVRDFMMGAINIGDFKKLSDTQLALAAQMKTSGGLDERTILHIIRTAKNEDELKTFVLRMTDRFSAESQGKVYEEIFKKHGTAANAVMWNQYGGNSAAMMKDLQNTTRELTRLTSGSLTSEDIAELVTTSFLAQNGQIQELDNKLVSDMLVAAGQSGFDGGQSLINFFKDNLSMIQGSNFNDINNQLLALAKNGDVSRDLVDHLSSLFMQVRNNGLAAIAPDKHGQVAGITGISEEAANTISDIFTDAQLRETNRVNKQDGQVFDQVNKAISWVNVHTEGFISKTSVFLDELFGGQVSTGDVVADGFSNVLKVLKSIRFSLLAGSVFKVFKSIGSTLSSGLIRLRSLFSSAAITGTGAAAAAAEASSGMIQNSTASVAKKIDGSKSMSELMKQFNLQGGTESKTGSAAQLSNIANSAANKSAEATAKKTAAETLKRAASSAKGAIVNVGKGIGSLAKTVGSGIAGIAGALGPIGIAMAAISAAVSVGGAIYSWLDNRSKEQQEVEKSRSETLSAKADAIVAATNYEKALKLYNNDENNPVVKRLKAIKDDTEKLASNKLREYSAKQFIASRGDNDTATYMETAQQGLEMLQAKQRDAAIYETKLAEIQQKLNGNISNEERESLEKEQKGLLSDLRSTQQEIGYIRAAINMSEEATRSTFGTGDFYKNLAEAHEKGIMNSGLSSEVKKTVGYMSETSEAIANNDITTQFDKLIDEFNQLSKSEKKDLAYKTFEQMTGKSAKFYNFTDEDITKFGRVGYSLEHGGNINKNFNVYNEVLDALKNEAIGSDKLYALAEKLDLTTTDPIGFNTAIIAGNGRKYLLDYINNEMEKRSKLIGDLGYLSEKDLKEAESQPTTQMAIGGVVNYPTKAIIGEDGKEAVLPLTKPDMLKRVLNALTREERLNIANSILNSENDLLSYNSLSSIDTSANYDSYAEDNLKERFRQVLNEAGLPDKLDEFSRLYSEAVRSVVASVSAESAQYAKQYAKHALSMIGSGNKDQIVAALKEIISYLSGIAKNNAVSRAPAQRLPNNVFGR